MRTIVIGLILACLISCTPLDLIKGAAKVGGGQPGVEVDANVGKAETEGDSSVAQNANVAVAGQINDSETYEGAVGQVVNNSGLQLHELLLLVLLAGWAIPSPSEMLVGTARTLRTTFRTLFY